MPTFSYENGYVPVSKSFIANKLPQANPTFIKVYLYLLMLAQEKASAQFRDIANTLGILESDLMQAVTYWEDQGEIIKNGDNFCFADSHEGTVTEATLHRTVVPSVTETQRPHENIADVISGNQSLSDMFMLAQEILGKTITEKEMETMYWFYSDLGLSPEIILLLLEYCVSKGKNRMSYIEKVAISWKEMGLDTSERVAVYLQSEEQKSGFLYSIRKIMGIADRSLSQTEEKFLTKWHDEYGIGEEMIALAYEYCIIQTAKLSFPYMDKIITRWHNEGIFTVEDAENDNRSFKSKTKPLENSFIDGYDHDSLEKLSRH